MWIRVSEYRSNDLQSVICPKKIGSIMGNDGILINPKAEPTDVFESLPGSCECYLKVKNRLKFSNGESSIK